MDLGLDIYIRYLGGKPAKSADLKRIWIIVRLNADGRQD